MKVAKLDKIAGENSDLEKIRAKLGHMSLEWRPVEYLDTGHPDVNEVFGHRTQGLAFGRIMEISGWEAMGKTALGLSLAALAQQQGAAIVWLDTENSFDATWAKSRGMEVITNKEGKVIGPDAFTLIQPYLGNFGKEAAPRITTAQELCKEAEQILHIKHKRFKKIVLVLDSIPALQTEMEAEAGLEGANMRTQMDLPMFLSRLLRRWIGMAQSLNAMIILLNQLRSSPDKYNPEYTPGGNAVRFYCHVRVKTRHAKGRVLKGHGKTSGKTIGMQGIVTNIKNKSGSPERAKVGFKLFWTGPLQFVDANKLEKEE